MSKSLSEYKIRKRPKHLNVRKLKHIDFGVFNDKIAFRKILVNRKFLVIDNTYKNDHNHQ